MMNIDMHFNYKPAMSISSQLLWLNMDLPLLRGAVDEAQNNIMAPRPLIFTSALTAIALVSQGLVDVCKPNGQVVPTSLMLLAIANSGSANPRWKMFFSGRFALSSSNTALFTKAKCSSGKLSTISG